MPDYLNVSLITYLHNSSTAKQTNCSHGEAGAFPPPEFPLLREGHLEKQTLETHPEESSDFKRLLF